MTQGCGNADEQDRHECPARALHDASLGSASGAVKGGPSLRNTKKETAMPRTRRPAPSQGRGSGRGWFGSSSHGAVAKVSRLRVPWARIGRPERPRAKTQQAEGRADREREREPVGIGVHQRERHRGRQHGPHASEPGSQRGQEHAAHRHLLEERGRGGDGDRRPQRVECRAGAERIVEAPEAFEIAVGRRPHRVLDLDQAQAGDPEAEPGGDGEEGGPAGDGQRAQACGQGHSVQCEGDEAGYGQEGRRDDDGARAGEGGGRGPPRTRTSGRSRSRPPGSRSRRGPRGGRTSG